MNNIVRIEGYGFADDTINTHIASTKTVYSMLADIKPTDTLETKRMILADMLDLKRKELEEMHGDMRALMDTIGELEDKCKILDKEIETEKTNHDAVGELRMVLPVNDNKVFKDVTSKFCDFIEQISQTLGNTSNEEEKKNKFLKALERVTIAFGGKMI